MTDILMQVLANDRIESKSHTKGWSLAQRARTCIVEDQGYHPKIIMNL
jgi:hypothetical protein